MGIFDYQSGKSQGILIHVVGMNPVLLLVVKCNVYNQSFCKGKSNKIVKLGYKEIV